MTANALEAAMLHTLKPAQFVVSHFLRTPWSCPECKSAFVYGDVVMSLTHYREADTDELKQGLICFCSTSCLLRWEHPTMLGRMH